MLDAVGRVTSQVTSEKALFFRFARGRFALRYAPKAAFFDAYRLAGGYLKNYGRS